MKEKCDDGNPCARCTRIGRLCEKVDTTNHDQSIIRSDNGQDESVQSVLKQPWMIV